MKNLSLILCALLLLVPITGCGVVDGLEPDVPVVEGESSLEETESDAESNAPETTDEVEIVHVHDKQGEYEVFTAEDGNRYIRFEGGEYEVFDYKNVKGWRYFHIEDPDCERYVGTDGKRYTVINEKHYEIFVDEKNRSKGVRGEYVMLDSSMYRLYLGIMLFIPYEGEPFENEELTTTIYNMFASRKMKDVSDYDSCKRYTTEDGTEYISYEGKDYKVFTSKDGGKYFLTGFQDDGIRFVGEDGKRYIVWGNPKHYRENCEIELIKDGVAYIFIHNLQDYMPLAYGLEEGKSYVIMFETGAIFEIDEQYANGKSYYVTSGDIQEIYYDETKEALGYEYIVFPNRGERIYLATYHAISGGKVTFGSEEMFSRWGMNGREIDLSDHPELFSTDVSQEVLKMIKAEITSDIRISLDNNGKIISDTEYKLTEETIKQIATLYYHSLEYDYEWKPEEFYKIKYIKDDGVWVCTFLTLPETIINEDGTVTFGYSFSSMHVVLRENGELVLMGF